MRKAQQFHVVSLYKTPQVVLIFLSHVFLLPNLSVGFSRFPLLFVCWFRLFSLEGGMEGKKSTGSADKSSTSSSIVSDLFGSKESSAPATEGSSSGRSGIFDSVFAMPERQTSQFEGLGTWRKQEHQVWSSRPTTSGSDRAKFHDVTVCIECLSAPFIDFHQLLGSSFIDSIFQSSSSENKVEPCFLSSSLFYGGREYCPPPKSAPETNKMYRDDDPDEKDSASRGNWWKGSLYY